jgi:hypothetical protein
MSGIDELLDPDDAEFERLAKLSLFEYERQRKGVAEVLDIRASILDRLVAAKRRDLGLDEEDTGQGRAIVFSDPEPWPESVDGDDLLDQITNALKRHIVMPEPARHLTAL